MRRGGALAAAVGASAAAGALLSPGAASAAPLPQLSPDHIGHGIDAGAINDMVTKAADQAPAPMKPVVDNFLTQVKGVVPSNLLRTQSAGSGDNFEAPTTTPVPGAGMIGGATTAPTTKAQLPAATPAFAQPQGNTGFPKVDMNQINVAAAKSKLMNGKLDFTEMQKLSRSLLDNHDGRKDPNTIGQIFGAAEVPTSETINQIRSDVNNLVARASDGRIVRDIQTAIDETLASEQFAVWRNNDRTIANVNHELRGVDRASNGIAHLIDEISTRPMQTANELINAAGGPANIVLNPVNALVRVATAVLGPDLVASARDYLNEAGDQLGQSLREATPALLIAPLAGLAGALLGAPLGGLALSGPGAILGALAPHNILAGLLTSVPGALLGGLASGSLGLAASLLLDLGAFGTLPLAGAVTGSALGLVVLSTVIYGLWALTLIPALIISGLIGAGLGALVALAGVAITGPGAPVMAGAIIGAAVLTFLFVTVNGTVGYALATAWIPTLAYLLLAPLFIGLPALLGVGAGLLGATIFSAIVTPLITALSALPGALSGGILGYFIGHGISSLISALAGAGLGALLGVGLGSLIGGLIGTGLGLPVALTVFGILAATNFGDWLATSGADPTKFPAQLREAMNRGWRESLLGQLVSELLRNWRGTETGQILDDLGARVNNLMRLVTFLDGRRLREMLLRGGLLGSLIGAALGAPAGGLLGALAGLFNPLNLLNGLMGALTGALVGAPLGAALGKGLSMLLGALTAPVAAALSFLPILLGLSALYAIPAIVTSLLAIGAALIPPAVIATAVWLVLSLAISSPLWLPLTIISSIATIVAFVAFGITAWSALFPPLLPFVAVAGTVATIAGTISTATAIADVIVYIGALALGLVTIWPITFLIALPFFIFPALGVPLAWLLGAPFLIPVAAGLSMLTGLIAGTAVDNLSSLLTVPVGALLGALTGATIGGVSATAIASLVRAITYGIAGSIIGAITGGVAGLISGMIAALLTHLRAGAGMDTTGHNPAFWVDGRIVNRGGFGDSMAFIPGLSGTKKSAFMAVPDAASPSYNVKSGTVAATDRAMTNATALVGV